MRKETRAAVETTTDSNTFRVKFLQSRTDAYPQAYAHMVDPLRSAVAAVLLDTRGAKVSAPASALLEAGEAFAALFKSHNAALVILIDESDPSGKIVGAGVLNAGARVLVTHDAHEAEEWLKAQSERSDAH
ncbi:MAG: hypothetical protein AAF850_03380 [Pseudomonadota bacterium]